MKKESTLARLQRRSLLQRREAREFYLFISPALVGVFFFAFGPMIFSLLLSFYKYNPLSSPQFDGLANYQKLVHDPLFWQALKVTAYYVAGSLPVVIIVSLAWALLLNQKVKGLAIWRAAYYTPAVITGVAVALLWMWIFNPRIGVINFFLLKFFGIEGPKWLVSKEWVIPAFIIMRIWTIGAPMIIFLAGLQSIPKQLYEAADIDGANRLQKFWNVTLPLLTPIIFFNLVIEIIGAFQIFTVGYVMTNGGPGHASLFYVLYLYRNGFEWFKMGYASALAWVLFLIVLFFTFLSIKSSPYWVYYGAEVKKR